MKPPRVIRLNELILETRTGKRIRLRLTPFGWIRISPEDTFEFLKSIPGLKEIIEEYQDNPPSKRINKLSRIRLIVLWLFSSGKVFPRKEVNRVIRVICETDPPLVQDVPRMAQEVLACPVFERLGKGYWRVREGRLNIRGRPPKPCTPSATEEAFRLMRERASEEFQALAIQSLRPNFDTSFSHKSLLDKELSPTLTPHFS